jgi:hypothetical protein
MHRSETLEKARRRNEQGVLKPVTVAIGLKREDPTEYPASLQHCSLIEMEADEFTTLVGVSGDRSRKLCGPLEMRAPNPNLRLEHMLSLRGGLLGMASVVEERLG